MYPKAAGFASMVVPSANDAKFKPSRNAKSLRNARVCQPFSIKNHPLDSTKTQFSLLPRLGGMAHERRKDLARFDGSRFIASMMFQPCFLAVEKKERMSAKSIAPSNAGDFLTKLHHAPVAFGLIVGEGNGRIAKEA